MGLNPETNRIEPCKEAEGDLRMKLEKLQGMTTLIRPNGEPVPKTWTTFEIGELVEIKGSTFRCAYIGETTVLFETVNPEDLLDSSKEG